MNFSKGLLRAFTLGTITFCISILVYDLWTAIGLGFFILVFVQFIIRLGNTIPVIEIIVLIATMQWFIGPFIAYSLEFQHFKYYMYVDRITYMSTIIPGLVFFALGLYFFIPKMSLNKSMFNLKNLIGNNYSFLPGYFISIGILADLLRPFFPASTSFLLYLISNFKFIGAALWLFRRESLKSTLGTILILGLTTLSSLRSGLFHDLLLWSAMLMSFIVLRFSLSTSWRVIFVISGFVLAFLIQSVKSDYRETLYSENNYEVDTNLDLSNLINDRIVNFNELIEDEQFLAIMNVRLNQGWIISAIIDNVPERTPYAEGETIEQAFEASLVPRILIPDKKIAGGRENFLRFTGLLLHPNASMGTSVIGEAYGNYGKYGSWWFMLAWGALLGFFFRKLILYGYQRPILLVFIPLIFLQVVKAETELYVVLNHLVKSTILVFGFLWFARTFLKWQI